MASFVEKLNVGNNSSIMLYRGVNEAGRDFFAYLLCTKQAVDQMHADFKADKKNVDIADYGHVVYVGFKTDPDEEAEAFLQKYVKRISVLADEPVA